MVQTTFAPRHPLTARPLPIAERAATGASPARPATPASVPGTLPGARDTFVRPSAEAASAPKMLGLINNAGHTTQILDLKAGMLEKYGEPEKADELRRIKSVYARVGAQDSGNGNCCSATSAILKAMKAEFGAAGPQHWRVDSIGVGDQGGSYAHQAVAITEEGKSQPTFVLDPTKMPWLKIPGIAGQGATNGWNQAYTLSEFLRTREANYGSGWTLGVP